MTAAPETSFDYYVIHAINAWNNADSSISFIDRILRVNNSWFRGLEGREYLKFFPSL